MSENQRPFFRIPKEERPGYELMPRGLPDREPVWHDRLRRLAWAGLFLVVPFENLNRLAPHD